MNNHVLHLHYYLQADIMQGEVEEIQNDEVQRRRYTELRRERILLRTRSIYRLPDNEFRKTFRVNKGTFERIICELTPYLKKNCRSDGITIESKIVAAMRFFAQGAYQRGVGKETGVSLSQPSVSKVLNEIINSINEHLLQRYITFPKSPEERQNIKEWFRKKYNIPGIIGVIDGTQIGIFPPATNNSQFPEFVYVNRKGFHAINTQIIVDHNYRILNINAKFPGSAHDAHIWKMSLVRKHLSNTYRNNHEWIIGDSGYPLEPWLLVPYKNVRENSPEMQFNNQFCSARSIVERAIGIIKGRWRCLCKQRQLHYNPTICSKIINSCAVLHNICIEARDALNEDEIYEEPANGEENIQFPAGNALHIEGNNNRLNILRYMNQIELN